MKNTLKLIIGVALVGVSLTTVLIVNARRENTDNSSIEEIQTSITTTTEVTTEPVVTETEKPTAVVKEEPKEEPTEDDIKQGIYALTSEDFENHTEAYMKEMRTIRVKFPAGFNCDEEIKKQSEGAQTMYKECKDDMVSAGIDNDTAGKKAWEVLELPIVDTTEPPEKPVAPIQPAKPNVKVPEGGYVDNSGVVWGKDGLPVDPVLRQQFIDECCGGVDPSTSVGEGGGPTGIILH